MYEVAAPTAYELDDLTYGILWAVANYDDALQADDQALAETRSDLKAYERLSASAVSREAAPGLNTVAHMWLGSDFCARHILRALPNLPEVPAFWTREQRGEEASAWLIFDHKYPVPARDDQSARESEHTGLLYSGERRPLLTAPRADLVVSRRGVDGGDGYSHPVHGRSRLRGGGRLRGGSRQGSGDR